MKIQFFLILLLLMVPAPAILFAQAIDAMDIFDDSRGAGETVQNSGTNPASEPSFSGENAQPGVEAIEEGDFDEYEINATYSMTIIPEISDGSENQLSPDTSALPDIDLEVASLTYKIEQFSRFLIRTTMQESTGGTIASDTP